MGTSQVPMVLKSAYKYGQGTVSLQIRLTQICKLSDDIRSERNSAMAIFMGRFPNQGYLWSSHDLKKILKL